MAENTFKDYVKGALKDYADTALSESLTEQSNYDEIITRWADKLAAHRDITNSEFWANPNYYAPTLKSLDPNSSKDFDHLEFNENVFEFIGELGAYDALHEADARRRCELLPQVIKDAGYDYIVCTPGSEDESAAKLRGQMVLYVQPSDGFYNDLELSIDDAQFGNVKIAPSWVWDAITENFEEHETDLVWHEVTNWAYETLYNILKAIKEELEENYAPKILKEGFLTELRAEYYDATDGSYDYDMLIGERDGEWYDLTDIIAIHDDLALVRRGEDEFAVLVVTGDNAEPWCHYPTLHKAMVGLQEIVQETQSKVS